MKYMKENIKMKPISLQILNKIFILKSKENPKGSLHISSGFCAFISIPALF